MSFNIKVKQKGESQTLVNGVDIIDLLTPFVRTAKKVNETMKTQDDKTFKSATDDVVFIVQPETNSFECGSFDERTDNRMGNMLIAVTKDPKKIKCVVNTKDGVIADF